MPLHIDNETLSNLLYTLYGAATTRDTNRNFLTLLKQKLNLLHATLITRPPTTTDSGLLFTSGEKSDIPVIGTAEGAYTSVYAQDPLVNLPLNEVVTIEDMIPRALLLESEFYQMILKPHDIYYIAGIDWYFPQASGDKFDTPGKNSRISIRFVRTRKQGNFTDAEKAFLHLLIPHLQQSVSLGVQLRQLDSERQIYADSISKRSIGMVTLDKNGNILKLNTAARHYLGENDGLSQVQQKIKIENVSRNDTLQRYLYDTLNTFTLQGSGNTRVLSQAISVPRPSGKVDYQIVVKPLPVNDEDASKLTPYLTIFIQDPDKNLEISVRTLMNLYQLTLSEATIAILLAEGHTTDDVAEELHIKKNTVRAHLRAMFAKTGVTQQSMLVSLVLTSLASTQ